MVPIHNKPSTSRLARATAQVTFSNPVPLSLLKSSSLLPKGDAFSVARITGIQGAKKTSEIIALAHPGLQIESCVVDLEVLDPDPDPTTTTTTTTLAEYSSSSGTETDADAKTSASPSTTRPGPYGAVLITSTVQCTGKTGVEMEALTSVMCAALNLVDMCKGVDKGVWIQGGRVVEKRGGKSGGWKFVDGMGLVRIEDDERGD
ncbi:putative molybdenum cofactor biosynthesis protein 1 a [Phaeomoniella chlamydospora]|uniref:Putative molybdenum cofactor biosynthesis protein 1 a n=1 Tax=Phaeomoniella chlamydospora TaxID=158046 RepID=A0A0G2F0W6_PHACM|nr:putative molybdenum cofactor biosynthesis protein 1 a [Phaeomoniella chlamydospora]